MIILKIEDNKDWYKLHIITQGECGREITPTPEWDVWIDMSKDEMRELRNALDYKLNYDYKGQKLEDWE